MVAVKGKVSPLISEVETHFLWRLWLSGDGEKMMEACDSSSWPRWFSVGTNKEGFDDILILSEDSSGYVDLNQLHLEIIIPILVIFIYRNGVWHFGKGAFRGMTRWKP